MKDLYWKQKETIGQYLSRMGIKPNPSWTYEELTVALDQARKIEYQDIDKEAVK